MWYFLSAGKAGPLAPRACMKTSHSETPLFLTRVGSLVTMRKERIVSSSSHVMSFMTYSFTSAEEWGNPIAMATNIV